jgi:UMP-CMP kinase
MSGYYEKYLKYKQKYVQLKAEQFLRNPKDQLYGGNEKSKAVFLLGGPGCGKGTNAEKIVRDFGYVHLSAGDLLREERNNPNSKQGELINSFMREGKLVPPEIPTQLLKNKMEELKKVGKNRFLIDGFPRSMLNLEFWNNIIGDSVDIDFVLFLNCFDENIKVIHF